MGEKFLITITINQWHIKHNEENPDSPKPPVCINVYRSEPETEGSRWGAKYGQTLHTWETPFLYTHSRVVYNPEDKTPCGASCWLEIETYNPDEFIGRVVMRRVERLDKMLDITCREEGTDHE